MNLEVLEKQIKEFQFNFKNGGNLKEYCLNKKLNYFYVSVLLTDDIDNLSLIDVYHILDFIPVEPIPYDVLNSSLSTLKEFKKVFDLKLL